jgi:hypothetical protein
MERLRKLWAAHKRAIQLFGFVAAGDALAGLWYAAVMGFPFTSGLCYTVGVTTTSGSSVPAGTSGTARLITLAAQVLLIPLAGAVFSLYTSHLTAGHVRTQLDAHHDGIHKKLDRLLGVDDG